MLPGQSNKSGLNLEEQNNSDKPSFSSHGNERREGKTHWNLHDSAAIAFYNKSSTNLYDIGFLIWSTL